MGHNLLHLALWVIEIKGRRQFINSGNITTVQVRCDLHFSRLCRRQYPTTVAHTSVDTRTWPTLTLHTFQRTESRWTSFITYMSTKPWLRFSLARMLQDLDTGICEDTYATISTDSSHWTKHVAGLSGACTMSAWCPWNHWQQSSEAFCILTSHLTYQWTQCQQNGEGEIDELIAVKTALCTSFRHSTDVQEIWEIWETSCMVVVTYKMKTRSRRAPTRLRNDPAHLIINNCELS